MKKVTKGYKPNLVRAPMRRLTEEILSSLGFRKIVIKQTKEIVWRIQPIYYPYIIQVKLGNYPSSNPNCGMVGLYRPAEGIVSFKGNKKIMVKQPETTHYIAWYVDTPERLRKIIISLTQQNV